MSKCSECKHSYIDFGNCLKKKCNPCEEEVRADERANTIDKIYSYVKRECNPYGKPTIDFESGKKILNYLEQLKEQNNE